MARKLEGGARARRAGRRDVLHVERDHDVVSSTTQLRRRCSSVDDSSADDAAPRTTVQPTTRFRPPPFAAWRFRAAASKSDDGEGTDEVSIATPTLTVHESDF